MPRSGDVYEKPAGTTAAAGEVIKSANFNTLIDDIVDDLNLDRPVAAGGTGASTAADARTNLAAAGTGVANTFAASSQTLQWTNDGSAEGPSLFFDRDSTTPAMNDQTGQVVFRGRDSAGNTADYSSIRAKILTPTNGVLDSELEIYTRVGNANPVSMAIANGVIIGSPTGSYQGTGTLNATAVYDDGTLLTPYVFEQELNGAIDFAALDSKVPNRVIPERRESRPRTERKMVRTEQVETVGGKRRIVRRIEERAVPVTEEVPVFDEAGRPTGETRVVPITDEVVTPAKTEVRSHAPARRFAANAAVMLDPEQYAQHWRTKRHLPSLPSEADWAAAGNFSMGDLVQRLMETVEVQAVHAGKMLDRIKALEARLDATGL